MELAAAKARIAELEGIIAQHALIADELCGVNAKLEAQLATIRAETIKECAQVAGYWDDADLDAAIRALAAAILRAMEMGK